MADIAGGLKRKRSYEIGIAQHNEIRSSDHCPKNVDGSCSTEKALTTPIQSQHYTFNKFQTISQPQKNLVGNFRYHGELSKMVTQDSVKEPISQVFVPESNNDFESEDETDSDYSPWEISGNQMLYNSC